MRCDAGHLIRALLPLYPQLLTQMNPSGSRQVGFRRSANVMSRNSLTGECMARTAQEQVHLAPETLRSLQLSSLGFTYLSSVSTVAIG